MSVIVVISVSYTADHADVSILNFIDANSSTPFLAGSCVASNSAMKKVTFIENGNELAYGVSKIVDGGISFTGNKMDSESGGLEPATTTSLRIENKFSHRNSSCDYNSPENDVKYRSDREYLQNVTGSFQQYMPRELGDCWVYFNWEDYGLNIPGQITLNNCP